MTQPAKVQEPSMEEILASIRRIIADDEAKPADVKPATKPASKPAAAEKPASPPPAKPEPAAAAGDEGYSAVGDRAASRRRGAQARAAACAGARRQQQPGRHRRDAGEPRRGDAGGRHPAGAARGRCVRTHRRDGGAGSGSPAASSFHKIEPQDDIEFTETAAAKALHRQPAYEPPPFESAAAAAPAPQILSRSTVSAVESAFNSLANTVLSNNARTLEDLVKEMLRPMLKSWLDDNLPGLVEKHRQSRDRAGFARALTRPRPSWP